MKARVGRCGEGFLQVAGDRRSSLVSAFAGDEVLKFPIEEVIKEGRVRTLMEKA